MKRKRIMHVTLTGLLAAGLAGALLLKAPFDTHNKLGAQNHNTLSDTAAWELFCTDSQLQGASIGLAVYNLTQGKMAFAQNEDLLLAPASVQKILTTATALELFPAGHRFRTQLATNGTAHGRTLDGQLFILPGGDPALLSPRYKRHYGNLLQKWAQIIKKQADTLTGTIVVANHLFAGPRIPRTWIWEDMGNYFGAGPSPLCYLDNTLRLHLQSPAKLGHPVKLLRTEPSGLPVEVANFVRASSIQKDLAYVFAQPDNPKLILRGTIPAGRKNFVVKASMPSPPRVLAQAFLTALQDAGVTLVSPRVELVPDKTQLPDTLRILAKQESPALSEIVRITNHRSVNLYAEQLLRHIGLKTQNEGGTSAGCEAIQAHWAKALPGLPPFLLYDGSGLSRFNGTSARQWVNILSYMKSESAASETFFKSLPVSGQSGTMKYFGRQTALAGKFHAKSGAIDRVRAYAGYWTAPGHDTLCIALLVNNYQGESHEIRQKMEKLLASLV